MIRQYNQKRIDSLKYEHTQSTNTFICSPKIDDSYSRDCRDLSEMYFEFEENENKYQINTDKSLSDKSWADQFRKKFSENKCSQHQNSTKDESYHDEIKYKPKRSNFSR